MLLDSDRRSKTGLPPIPLADPDVPPPYEIQNDQPEPSSSASGTSSSPIQERSTSSQRGSKLKRTSVGRSAPTISISRSRSSSPTLTPPFLTSPSTNTVSLDTLLPHRTIARNDVSTASVKPSVPKSSKSRSWFRASQAPNDAQVEAITAVNDLVKNLIRPGYSNTSSPSQSVLQSCADACSSHSLMFSDVLQKKSIEGHIPLYWAVLNRPHDSDEFDLISNLLYFSSPLTPSSISEIRHACLARGDQALFQRLRLSPEFAPLSGTDEMLLGGSMPPDNITVETSSSDDVSFVAHCEIAHFQKRMRVSKEVVLEFIARSRMWRLTFTVLPEKHKNVRIPTWTLAISLLEDSPPTFVDSQFLILDSAIQPPITPSRGSFVIDSIAQPPSPMQRPASSHLSSFDNTASFGQSKPRPSIPVVLKSMQEVVSSEGKPRGGHGRKGKEIKVTLDHSLLASSLQNSGSSYVSGDDTLRARWEVKLAKPESEGCVIC